HLNLPEIHAALDHTPRNTSINVDAEEAAWDPAQADQSADQLLADLAGHRFELLERLEAAPDEVWDTAIHHDHTVGAPPSLIELVSGAQRTAKPIVDNTPVRTGVADSSADDRASLRPRPVESGPLLRLLPRAEESAPTATLNGDSSPEPWIVAERPPLDGTIPDGWQPNDR